jgi:hypothetical protein
MKVARKMLMVAVCLGSGLAVSANDSHQLPYDDLARNALVRAGLDDIDPRGFSFERFFEAGFLHTRLGIYDLYLPAGRSLDTDELEDYRAMALTLLDAQGVWLDWLAPSARGMREPLGDLKKVRGWVKGWKSDELLRVAQDGQREALDALRAKASVRKASEQLAEFMGLGAALSLKRNKPVFEPVVLVPDRERFVEMVCIGGWLYPRERRNFWHGGITNWTHFYVDHYKFLSLELTDPNQRPGNWTNGVSMNYRNPQAMAQQVAQLAIGSLLDNYYEERIPPALAGALSMNLVIELFGECDTRADGDLRVRRTGAREVFVPGGQSEGGVLPPLRADSRWRDRHGSDHFVSLLRQAQRDGATKVRKAREKHKHFVLLSDSGGSRQVVTAPFLGAGATTADELPEEFRGDWVEFLRSYRSCFLWWLQNKAERSAKKSGGSFATLLEDLAVDEEDLDLPMTFARTYDGDPLSCEDPGKKDLEGRFLRWLAKQR